MYQEALKFIVKAHAGQKRRNGNPYIIHPIRVSQEVKSDVEKVVALLHDVLEDTKTDYATILATFGPEAAGAVEALTHRKDEPYMDYLARVKANPIALTVKIADIADNLGDSPSDSAIEKMSKGLDYLVN
jgi:(p)ppGpp synthase/HD superfamily hydrolase